MGPSRPAPFHEECAGRPFNPAPRGNSRCSGSPRFEPNRRGLSRANLGLFPVCAGPEILAQPAQGRRGPGLSVTPEGARHRQSWTGSANSPQGLAFSEAWPCTFKHRDSIGGSLSDVPPGCPKGNSSDHHGFAETRKGVPTDEGRHARCTISRPSRPSCQEEKPRLRPAPRPFQAEPRTIGSCRGRCWPRRASALATAGPIGGTPGSPTPVGFSADLTIVTSTSGISLMRSDR